MAGEEKIPDNPPDDFMPEKPQSEREMQWKIMNKLAEKPEILDKLVERLKSEDIVDFDGNPVE